MPTFPEAFPLPGERHADGMSGIYPGQRYHSLDQKEFVLALFFSVVFAVALTL